MFRFFYTFCSLVLMTLSCAPVQTSFPEAASVVSVSLHGDTDFSEEERSMIEAQATKWKVQTGGQAEIRIVWDLDFSDREVLEELKDKNIMVRVESDNPMVIDEECSLNKRAGLPCDYPGGPKLLGSVAPTGGIHNVWRDSVRVVFVADRFNGQVVLHEFGHVFGIPHQPETYAVMYPSFIRHERVCLKQADLSAFCTVNSCNPNIPLVPCLY